MERKVKVALNIAGKGYNINVANESEKQDMEVLANHINDKIKDIEQKYKLKDKDALVFSSITLLSECEERIKYQKKIISDLTKRIEALNNLISMDLKSSN